VKNIFAVALGVLTAIGGFLDIGDLVTTAVVGSRFRHRVGLGHPRRRAGHLPVRPDGRPGRRVARIDTQSIALRAGYRRYSARLASHH
jgi:hypothetical protein